MAPREEHKSEHCFGEPETLQILRAVNQGEKFGNGLSLCGVQLSTIKQQALEYTKQQVGASTISVNAVGLREPCRIPTRPGMRR